MRLQAPKGADAFHAMQLLAEPDDTVIEGDVLPNPVGVQMASGLAPRRPTCWSRVVAF